MTGADDSDGGDSRSRSDHATRFGDIASEFDDEFGAGSEDDPDPGWESESGKIDDDAGGRTSEPDSDVDHWEWIGDDESGDDDETGQNSAETEVIDPSERSNRDGRLWNDGATDDGATDDRTTADGATENRSTDDRSVEVEPAGGPSGDDAGRAAAGVGGSGTKPDSDDKADAPGDRIWNESSATRGSSTTTETTRSPSDRSVSAEPSPTETPEMPDTSGFDEDASALDGKRLDTGTNVLIQSESRSERTHDGCHELLFGREGNLDPDVLLVRYQPMDGERLENIASNGHRTHVISVGYAQSVPPAVDGTVEVTQINNPNDITRLGIVVSRVTQGWAAAEREIRVCYDSLNVLLNYRDVKNAFRFLHVFLSTFTKTDAVAHFHADPLEGDPQAINTVKPLFDEIVSIDSTGTYVE